MASPIRFDDQSFTSGWVNSNGTLMFEDSGPLFAPGFTGFFPIGGVGALISPFFDDLNTAGAGRGIFTALSGTAPKRIYQIQWRVQAASNTALRQTSRFVSTKVNRSSR